MSSHSVLEDDSLLSRLDRALFRVESALNLAGGLLILAVMLLSVANILGRKLFDAPISGYIDWMIQAVPLMAVLGIGYCQRLGGHIRMDFVIGKLNGRAVWAFELLSTLLMLIITAALIYGTWDHAERAIRLGDSTVDINLPIWPTKLAFPIMFALLAVRLTLQLWAYWRALAAGELTPVAVPLIEDAAAQARHEAETVSGLEDEASGDGGAAR
ncbi:TRAP transporter small permease subunit [Oceanicella actignis]|uniref:TRAP transporter small permease subunit n=1 Tax=Oceanicella actignis TaxID=1189325 RepID=UPI0011E70EB6|nr:TRAP transporter small permease subunit [Oceanicella actignis]TYO90735.1 TRAP-type mannitol/chloroaromatic compound transport system permease small subunit [Oceanicella actignis]